MQSLRFANKSTEAQGREEGFLRSHRKPEARLGLWTSNVPNMLHIWTPQDPGWEINANQALELWDCQHFINIQMRETFRLIFSRLPIPFFTGGLASFPPRSREGLLTEQWTSLFVWKSEEGLHCRWFLGTQRPLVLSQGSSKRKDFNNNGKSWTIQNPTPVIIHSKAAYLGTSRGPETPTNVR